MTDPPPVPLRVGLFHGTLPEPDRKPGGVEIAVHRLANALAARADAAVTVYSLSPAPADAAYRHVRLARADRWVGRRRLTRLFGVAAALNFVPIDQDVLHLHGDDWFYFRRPVPTVRTLHGSALYEGRTATSLKRKLSQRFIYGLEHLSARLATVCAAVGPQTLSLYGGTQLVDNGVDLATFHPGPKAVRPRVLFVGTWAGRKRGRVAYEAFLADVRPRVPDAELFMVCDECPPAAGVVHVVRPTDVELADLYRSAWVFAYPSAYEGFGIPYLEAMASGTAIVSSPNPGAAYVLRDGRLGRVVDDAAFGPAVAELLLDADARGRLERAGVEAAAAFTWDRVAEAHMAVYRAAVAR